MAPSLTLDSQKSSALICLFLLLFAFLSLDFLGPLPIVLKCVLQGYLNEGKVCDLLREVWLVVIGILRSEFAVGFRKVFGFVSLGCMVFVEVKCEG